MARKVIPFRAFSFPDKNMSASKTLHILNGDTITPMFSELGLAGEKVVVREMFCEGPTLCEVGTKEFWEERASFFENNLGISRSKYESYSRLELIQVESVGQFEEVILWFEYDLFCTVNLLAMLSWIQKIGIVHTRISLVCSGDHSAHKKRVGLGELSATHFLEHHHQRVSLEKRT